MLRWRIYGLAFGYLTATTLPARGPTPMVKLMPDRDPVTDRPLPSQPTLSRLKKSLLDGDLDTMETEFIRIVPDSQQQRRHSARIITIDLDPTVDPTHGHQQKLLFNTLFNGFYDTSCSWPPVVTVAVTFDYVDEQYVVASQLRQGNVHATEGVEALPAYLRALFPEANLRIRLDRLDSGFQQAELLNHL